MASSPLLTCAYSYCFHSILYVAFGWCSAPECRWLHIGLRVQGVDDVAMRILAIAVAAQRAQIALQRLQLLQPGAHMFQVLV